MKSVERLTLSLQNSDFAILNILHIIHFPAASSFNLRLGLSSIDRLEEVMGVVYASCQGSDPSPVAELTLRVERECGSPDSLKPIYVVED